MYAHKTVEIEFDTTKDDANIVKHGVPLSFGAQVFRDENHLLVASIRPIDGEDRFKVIGIVDGKLWTAVHVVRGKVTRFLSVRRSNDGERKAYDSD